MPKNTKNAKSTKPLTEAELDKLVGLGTKEAQNKIKQFIKNEKDPAKRDLAERALTACEARGFEPKNAKEEQDFILCELIATREQEVAKLEAKTEQVRLELEKLALEKKVHDRLMSKNKDRQEDWGCSCIDDLLEDETGKLDELEGDIEYDKAWIDEAKKMITTARYKGGIPAQYMDQYDFGFDDDCDDDCCGGRCEHRHHDDAGCCC
ncbi:hypothetical protein HGA64_03410 [Candidatus Falkowbacteria bacterium]|nr:hypothetical protein [Candidatus Falkowbacteria bacterium]